jgi:hypothetical protein
MLHPVIFCGVLLSLVCLVRYLSRLWLEKEIPQLSLEKVSYHLNNILMIFTKLSLDPSSKIVFESKDAVSLARILESCVCQSNLYDLNILCKSWIDIWQITVWREPHMDSRRRVKIHGFH